MKIYGDGLGNTPWIVKGGECDPHKVASSFAAGLRRTCWTRGARSASCARRDDGGRGPQVDLSHNWHGATCSPGLRPGVRQRTRPGRVGRNSRPSRSAARTRALTGRPCLRLLPALGDSRSGKAHVRADVVSSTSKVMMRRAPAATRWRRSRLATPWTGDADCAPRTRGKFAAVFA